MTEIEIFDTETIWASHEYGQLRWPNDTEFVKYKDIKHLLEKEVVVCADINSTDECSHAYLDNGFLCCKYKDHCQNKRLRIIPRVK